jgi:Trk-type K+ transport system membrane component
LTEEQRDELGGVEYRAIKLLLVVLIGKRQKYLGLIIGYIFGLTFFSWICLAPWIARDQTYGAIVDAANVNRGWWAVFTGSSMFNDLGKVTQVQSLIVGYTFTPDSMLSFQRAVFPLLLGSFLIIAG